MMWKDLRIFILEKKKKYNMSVKEHQGSSTAIQNYLQLNQSIKSPKFSLEYNG